MKFVLSICCGMGLFDKAFLDAGFHVIPGCEINPIMRKLHEHLCGDDVLCHDIADLPALCGDGWDGMIGGPPCQAHSKTRAMRTPKYPDLTPQVLRVLEVAKPAWYLFENVTRVAIPGALHVKLDAMHFGRPHQSRPRWFTYSPNLTPPPWRVHWQRKHAHGLPVSGGPIVRAQAGSGFAGVPHDR